MKWQWPCKARVPRPGKLAKIERFLAEAVEFGNGVRSVAPASSLDFPTASVAAHTQTPMGTVQRAPHPCLLSLLFDLFARRLRRDPVLRSPRPATPLRSPIRPPSHQPRPLLTCTLHHAKVRELILKWDRTHRSLTDVHLLNDDEVMTARLFEDVEAFSETVQDIGSFIDGQLAGHLIHHYNRVEYYLPEIVRAKDADLWAKLLGAGETSRTLWIRSLPMCRGLGLVGTVHPDVL